MLFGRSIDFSVWESCVDWRSYMYILVSSFYLLIASLGWVGKNACLGWEIGLGKMLIKTICSQTLKFIRRL
jgi:hypothetical protein